MQYLCIQSQKPTLTRHSVVVMCGGMKICTTVFLTQASWWSAHIKSGFVIALHLLSQWSSWEMPVFIGHFAGWIFKFRHVMCLWSYGSSSGSLGLHYSLGYTFSLSLSILPKPRSLYQLYREKGPSYGAIQVAEVAASTCLWLLDLAHCNLL